MATVERRATLDRELYRWHAEICKVFSHALRLEIVAVLRTQELSVSRLAARLGVSIGNLSQHLNMMKQRRVLAARKEANNVYYRLANPRLVEAFDLIRDLLLEQMHRESARLRDSGHMRPGRPRRGSQNLRKRVRLRG